MKCPGCGAENPDGIAKCHCGYAFNSQSAVKNDSFPKTVNTLTLQQPQPGLRYIKGLIIFCSALTILQIAILSFSSGPKMGATISTTEGQMYQFLGSYSGVIAATWILSVSVCFWLLFYHRSRRVGVLLVTLSPFAYTTLVALLWGANISFAWFWNFQILKGTTGYISTFRKYLVISGSHHELASFLDITNPTAFNTAVLLAAAATCAYVLLRLRPLPSKKNVH